MKQSLIYIAAILIAWPFLAVQSKDARELFPVCDEDRCGYIDAKGNIAIKLQFDWVGDFSDGLARITIGNKYGFIDGTGKLVISPQFEVARDFKADFAAVTCDPAGNSAWGFVDRTGAIAIQKLYRSVGDFSKGLAAVQLKDTRWGYIDRTGTTAIPPQFVAAFPFTEGLARLWTGPYHNRNKYGAIDSSGQVVIEPRFDNIVDDFHQGLAPFRLGKKWGFIDRTGQVVIAPHFDSARGFSEGMAAVGLRNKFNVLEWGFADMSGDVVIRPQFVDVGNYSEELAWVMRNGGKVGWIDSAGKLVIPYKKLDWVDNFRGGLAEVTIAGNRTRNEHGSMYRIPKAGYITKQGKFVWKPTYGRY